MPQPKSSLTFFTDRCLGDGIIPQGLRDAGLTIVTMNEHYGKYPSHGISDPLWLKLVGENGWVALTKDMEIRRNPNERQAVLDYGVQGFGLSRQDLKGPAALDRFLQYIPEIQRACHVPGPFWYSLQPDKIVKVL